MRQERNYYVYIITNKNNTVFYIGTTRNLEGRIRQHKNKELEGFSKKYNLNKLVYYEEFQMATEAFEREKQLKRWRRSKKEWLINMLNSKKNDLSKDWL
ncbi:MAG: GIY-YIG nuclease family protein [bacterium]|nr:GIY-YIG nuclease family protein [bacterium]